MLQWTAARPRTRHPPSGATPAPCRSVLMVGTDPDGRGGIRTVVRGLLDAGLFERLDGEYVATHRLGSRWAKISAALHGWLRVWALLRRLDAPLVHIQMSSRASFWRKSVVCLMARLAGRPYLLHIHSGEFVQFYAKESGALVQRYIRGILAHAALVIALSEQWRERLLSICPSASIEVLPNSVELPLESEVRRVPNARPQILYLGDLSRNKGTHDLVSALARVAQRFPDLELVCAGNGSPAELRALAAELHVQHRLKCPGWLDPPRKRDALARATLFALPSYAEGMPMALLEAMAWELPVIATPVGGIPQLLTHAANGLLVEPGDVEALAAAIALLVSDAPLRSRLGTAARATIESGFTLDQTLARLSRIYRRFGIELRA